MVGKTSAELRPGDFAELERHVDMPAIAAFIEAVGDYNPIHSDPIYAASTSFREPIAPGVFTAGLISAVIGTQLPGPGTLYISQELKFLKPVFPGDVITATAVIAEIDPERNRVRLKTVCTNQDGVEVLAGDAWVKPPRERIEYIVGLGETLYFEQSYGAAAAVFDSVLQGGELMLAGSRDRVLDWWADSLEHDARPRPEMDRRAAVFVDKLADGDPRRREVDARLLNPARHREGTQTLAAVAAEAREPVGPLL